MARWRGFSERLQTPADLLAKLRHDLARLEQDPADPYAAFDFVITAEHMVDWRWPDDPAKRDEVRGFEPLATISHLASGAKHFEATRKRHRSITGVSMEEDHGTAVLGRARLGEMVLGSEGSPALVVTMSGEDRRVTALALARIVVAHWREELGEFWPGEGQPGL